MANVLRHNILDVSSTVRPTDEDLSTLAKGAGIVFLGAVFSGLVTYGYNAFIARTLGVRLYGVYSLGLYIFNIATLLALIGIHTGVLRHVALYNGSGLHDRTRGIVVSACWITLPASICVGMLLVFFSDFLAIQYFHEPLLGRVFRILAAGIPFFSISTIYMFATQGLKVMRYRVVIRNFFDPIGKLVFTIAFFWLGWKLHGVVIAYVGTTILGTLLFKWSLGRLFPFGNRDIGTSYNFKGLFLFSLPLMPVGIFQALSMRIEPLLLGNLGSSSEVGVYSAAYQTAMLISMVLMSLNTIFSPIISDLYHKEQIVKLQELFRVVAKWTIMLCMPLFIIIVFFSRDILALFGREFVGGEICLVILALGQLLHSACGSVGFVLTMAGKTVLVLINTMGFLVFRFIMNIFLIPKMGLTGAALSSTVSIVLLNFVMIIEMSRIVGIQAFGISYFRPVICGILTIIITLALKSLPGSDYGMLGILGVMILYGVLLFWFGLDKDDKAMLEMIRKKMRGKMA